MEDKIRCAWVSENSDQLETKYHDEEWGVPIHDDKLLFELLVLEAAQSGLSWITILRKRENYREAYDNFDISKISSYCKNREEELLQNSGIIRNRLKIQASVTNAKIVLQIIEEFGSFSKYIWQFVNYKQKRNKWKNINEVPTSSKESEAMSCDMKKRGFKFVGNVTCYSFMQACGMVNDHTDDCFRYRACLS